MKIKIGLFFACAVFVFVNIWQWSASFKHKDAYEISPWVYLTQPDEITCGTTSVAMLLKSYGKDVALDQVKLQTKTQWFQYKGRPVGCTLPEYVPMALRYFGVPAEMMTGNLDRLKYYVDQKRPPIVLIRSGALLMHYVVVIGYTPDMIITADPADGSRWEVPVDHFMKSWDFTADTVGVDQPGYLEPLVLFVEVYPRTMIVPSIDMEGSYGLQEAPMFWLLGWLFFGLIVGLLAKALHPGEDPVGFLPTVGIGVAGSIVGGGIRWLLNMGGPFHPAGFMWSIIGGMIFCYLYRRYRLGKFVQAQGRLPDYTQFKK